MATVTRAAVTTLKKGKKSPEAALKRGTLHELAGKGRTVCGLSFSAADARWVLGTLASKKCNRCQAKMKKAQKVKKAITPRVRKPKTATAPSVSDILPKE